MKRLPRMTVLAFPLPQDWGRAGEVVDAAVVPKVQCAALASPITAAITA
jgi:hypothetical protein